MASDRPAAAPVSEPGSPLPTCGEIDTETLLLDASDVFLPRTTTDPLHSTATGIQGLAPPRPSPVCSSSLRLASAAPSLPCPQFVDPLPHCSVPLSRQTFREQEEHIHGSVDVHGESSRSCSSGVCSAHQSHNQQRDNKSHHHQAYQHLRGATQQWRQLPHHYHHHHYQHQQGVPLNSHVHGFYTTSVHGTQTLRPTGSHGVTPSTFPQVSYVAGRPIESTRFTELAKLQMQMNAVAQEQLAAGQWSTESRPTGSYFCPPRQLSTNHAGSDVPDHRHHLTGDEFQGGGKPRGNQSTRSPPLSRCGPQSISAIGCLTERDVQNLCLYLPAITLGLAHRDTDTAILSSISHMITLARTNVESLSRRLQGPALAPCVLQAAKDVLKLASGAGGGAEDGGTLPQQQPTSVDETYVSAVAEEVAKLWKNCNGSSSNSFNNQRVRKATESSSVAPTASCDLRRMQLSYQQFWHTAVNHARSERIRLAAALAADLATSPAMRARFEDHLTEADKRAAAHDGNADDSYDQYFPVVEHALRPSSSVPLDRRASPQVVRFRLVYDPCTFETELMKYRSVVELARDVTFLFTVVVVWSLREVSPAWSYNLSYAVGDGVVQCHLFTFAERDDPAKQSHERSTCSAINCPFEHNDDVRNILFSLHRTSAPQSAVA